MTTTLQHGLADFQPDHLSRLPALATALRDGNQEAAAGLCAATLWAGFVQPAALTAVWDHICLPWLNEPLPADSLLPDLPQVTGAPSAAFWPAFDAVLDDATAGRLDAISITSRVAALSACLDDDFGVRAEGAARAHPGSAGAALRNMPQRTTIDTLAALPDASLGNRLYRMITDNNFDLEVLDRDAIGLAGLPPALRWLNTRILQMHDIWHLTAGYQTTGLHEIAISAFQLAQFGHNYSGQFLATVLCVSQSSNPAGLPVLLQTMSEAWRHGRNTPPLMAIDWEAEWHQPVAEVRAKHGITPFESAVPADLFEQLRAAAPASASP